MSIHESVMQEDTSGEHLLAGETALSRTVLFEYVLHYRFSELLYGTV